MSKEIPDFNPGRVDIDADDDLGEEILDDGYGNNEAGSIDEEIGEPLKTSKEILLGRKGNELAPETKNTLDEAMDNMRPEEKA
ncbi:MAG: hypothetical protein WCT33_05435 [Patescibacteria group bacterium]|jgi:hypothetical protein